MPESEKVSILIVDDETENLIALQKIIARPEMNIMTATSGTDALHLMQKSDPVLVLLSDQMPGMGGFETADRMQESKKTKQIPIIFITSACSKGSWMPPGPDVRVFDYVTKPVNTDILKQKVNVFITLALTQKDLKKTINKLRSEIDWHRHAEEELRDKKKLEHVIETTRHVCHELNQPLQIISGYSELMLIQSSEDNPLYSK